MLSFIGSMYARISSHTWFVSLWLPSMVIALTLCLIRWQAKTLGLHWSHMSIFIGVMDTYCKHCTIHTTHIVRQFGQFNHIQFSNSVITGVNWAGFWGHFICVISFCITSFCFILYHFVLYHFILSELQSASHLRISEFSPRKSAGGCQFGLD